MVYRAVLLALMTITKDISMPLQLVQVAALPTALPQNTKAIGEAVHFQTLEALSAGSNMSMGVLLEKSGREGIRPIMKLRLSCLYI